MKLKQFLELFNPLPGNCYLQVSTEKNSISFELEKLIQSVDGKFKLILYNNENLDFSKPLKVRPREHDIVILQNIISKHQNPKAVVRSAYTTLANTADIILLERKDAMSIEDMKNILQEHEFRAINDIDILDNYNLVMGKKMHMWGNGL
jgi:3-dehydroquinate synthase class II